MSVGGVVILTGFTTDDVLYQNPINKNRCFFKSQELKEIFSDFEIIFYIEKAINEQSHQGCEEPHQHNIGREVAKKYLAKS